MGKEGLSRREFFKRVGWGVLGTTSAASLGMYAYERITAKSFAEKVEYHTHGFQQMDEGLARYYADSTASIVTTPYAFVSKRNEILDGIDPQAGKLVYLDDTKNFAEKIEQQQGPLSFIGGVQTRNTLRINFWQKPGDNTRTITIDPKAVDASISWIFDTIMDYQQIDVVTGPDVDKRLGLLRIQEKEQTIYPDVWQPSECTISVMINADREECLSESESIVPEESDACKYLGVEIGNAPNIPIILTIADEVTTKKTARDSGTDNLIYWRTQQDEATNAVFMHEFTHGLVRMANIFWENDLKMKNMSEEHNKIVDPVENAFVAYWAECQRRKNHPFFPLSFT